MACEICGRPACMSSFHSLEEQEAYDEVADRVKHRICSGIANAVERLDREEFNNEQFVNLNEVLKIVDRYA